MRVSLFLCTVFCGTQSCFGASTANPMNDIIVKAVHYNGLEKYNYSGLCGKDFFIDNDDLLTIKMRVSKEGLVYRYRCENKNSIPLSGEIDYREKTLTLLRGNQVDKGEWKCTFISEQKKKSFNSSLTTERKFLSKKFSGCNFKVVVCRYVKLNVYDATESKLLFETVEGSTANLKYKRDQVILLKCSSPEITSSFEYEPTGSLFLVTCLRASEQFCHVTNRINNSTMLFPATENSGIILDSALCVYERIDGTKYSAQIKFILDDDNVKSLLLNNSFVSSSSPQSALLSANITGRADRVPDDTTFVRTYFNSYSSFSRDNNNNASVPSYSNESAPSYRRADRVPDGRADRVPDGDASLPPYICAVVAVLLSVSVALMTFSLYLIIKARRKEALNAVSIRPPHALPDQNEDDAGLCDQNPYLNIEEQNPYSEAYDHWNRRRLIKTMH